ACARHRKDAAGDTVRGIRLANAGTGWRDARYLEGLAPAAVPLVGHESLEYSASEIGGSPGGAACRAVARRNARHRREDAGSLLVQRSEAWNLDGLAPAAAPLAGHEHLGGAGGEPIASADGAVDR